MATATELGSLQKRPHHGPAMRRNVIENLLIGYACQQSGAILFHQQGRFAHYVSANAVSGSGLNSMTGNTRDAVIIERSFDVRIFCQSASEKRRGVMT